MKEKKNIDRLFQEKFKEFESAPPEFVWDNIEAELTKDKRRRVIPIWFKLIGVAALLLIGLLLINPFEQEQEFRQQNNPVVIGEDNNPTDGNTNPDDAINPSSQTEGNSILQNNSNTAVVVNEQDGNTSGDQINSSGDGVRTSGNQSGVSGSRKQNSLHNNNTAVVANDTRSNQANSTQPKANDSNTKSAKVTGNNDIRFTESRNAVAESGVNNPNKTAKGSNDNASSGTEVVNQNAKISTVNENAVADNNNEINTAVEGNDVNENPVSSVGIDRSITIDEAVAETAIDTAATEEPENELEKLLQEKLNEKNKEKLAQSESNAKWNVRPQVAPVFYNSLSQGSPIDAGLASNSKDFNNNLSYGVGVDYALSDRISIRSGVNTVNLSYSTNGVAFYPSMSRQTNNIGKQPQSSSANMVVMSASDATQNINPTGATAAQTFSGSLLQEMGYIEVPVEMSYALLNKKFGVEVIGGISTLFLNNNQVSVVTDQGYSSTLGEAENLNNIHFSTNVGLGFRYRFTKALQANFEPTFKYQVNAFSSDAGNFKPYFIGLYSGISFSF